MWKTGVASISFRKNSVEEIIAAAAAAGLDGIEWGSDVHVPAGDVARAAAVRRLTEAAGLAVLSYGGYYRLGSGTPADFDALLASAEALGVRDVRIWGGGKGSAELSAAEWDALVAEGKALAAKAAEKGIVLSLECHNGTVTDDCAAAQRYLDAVGSPALRMYWQPNQVRTEGYNLTALRQLAPRVTNIHVFAWEGDAKKQLAHHDPQWNKRLTVLEELLDEDDHAFLLEFMPDDKLETLAGEAQVLNEWLERRGLRAVPQQPLCLLPQPKSVRMGKGWLPFAADGELLMPDRSLYRTVRIACRRRLESLRLTLATAGTPAVVLRQDDALEKEGYRLTVAPGPDGRMAQVTVEYAAPQGAFYALSTLEQLLTATPGRLPVVTIDDAPDFAVRGYMLDIGRGRVPTRTELLALVDKLAAWKINHLELYIEGVPFTYPSFPEMWEGHELLTGEDILALDAACAERFIELVPTQNNFGHMDQWLYRRFRHLAECPDGFDFDGHHLPDPRSLNPGDPGSLELVRHLADDLLPYFSGNKYNICCDETLELGQGASKAACEERGMEAVYVDFVNKVCEVAHAHGCQPLIWDDIVRHAPEQIRRLPQDAILLHWGYEAGAPYEENLQRLQQLHRPYYVCPGTSAWNAYIGNTDKMMGNIIRSGRLGKKYGAAGLLNTDWGDAGHLQSISSCYAGIAFGAAVAWNVENNARMDLAAALDVQVFEDANRQMGRFVLDAGCYPRYEGVTTGNSTLSMRLNFNHDPSCVTDADPDSFDRVEAYLQALLPVLESSDMHCADADKIKAEYRWGIRFVCALQDMGRAYKARGWGDAAAEAAQLRTLQAQLPGLALECRRCWLARSRQSWLEESMQQFGALDACITERLAEIG